MKKSFVTQAISAATVVKIAAATGLSVRAVYKWRTLGRLPRTELTGETDYATIIARLCRENGHKGFSRTRILDATKLKLIKG